MAIPPGSTKPRNHPDSSGQLEAPYYGGSSAVPPHSPFVSSSPNRSPERLKFATNDTTASQISGRFRGASARSDEKEASEPNNFDHHPTPLSITENIGPDIVCLPFRKKIFKQLPSVATDLALQYKTDADRYSHVEAHQNLQKASDQLIIGDLNLLASDRKLRKFSEVLALRCLKVSQELGSPYRAYKQCSRLAKTYRIEAPKVKTGNYESALKRFIHNRWWIKKIRSLKRQSTDTLYRDLGCVNKKKNLYTADYTFSLHEQQERLNQQYMENTTISNQDGEEISLARIAETNTSNPTNRRHELMARIHGFETVADTVGHVGEFYTLTTPSRFHAYHHNGKANRKFEQLTPKDAQQWLNQTWAMIRAELARQGIRPFGFRVAEPHHDGTPHWHFLLFMSPEHTKLVRKIVKKYALRETEKGAKKYRFKAVKIDRSKGSAAGYIAKYVAKNIDGTHVGDDRFGGDAQSNAKRIRCWASTWNIRQFQQIGGPSVTVWRELRRLRNTIPGEMETARAAADSGDWAAYVFAMGGIDVSRKDRPIQPVREFRELVNLSTGEQFTDNKSQYDDEKKAPIRGLACNHHTVITRKHFWSKDKNIALFDRIRPTSIPAGDALQVAFDRIVKGSVTTALGLV